MHTNYTKKKFEKFKLHQLILISLYETHMYYFVHTYINILYYSYLKAKNIDNLLPSYYNIYNNYKSK